LSVLEIVDTILRLMDRRDLAPEILGQVSEELPVKHSSSFKARERLGWSAGVTLEAGLKKTIDWYRENLNTIDAITKAE